MHSDGIFSEVCVSTGEWEHNGKKNVMVTLFGTCDLSRVYPTCCKITIRSKPCHRAGKVGKEKGLLDMFYLNFFQKEPDREPK